MGTTDSSPAEAPPPPPPAAKPPKSPSASKPSPPASKPSPPASKPSPSTKPPSRPKKQQRSCRQTLVLLPASTKSVVDKRGATISPKKHRVKGSTVQDIITVLQRKYPTCDVQLWTEGKALTQRHKTSLVAAWGVSRPWRYKLKPRGSAKKASTARPPTRTSSVDPLDASQQSWGPSHQLFVRPLSGHTLTIRVQASATVESLMMEVAARTGIKVADMRLIAAGGRDLQLGQLLSDYNLHSMSNIDLAVRIRGGDSGTTPTGFADMSKDGKEVEFSVEAPDWRSVSSGLNLSGKCTNKTCDAHDKEVIIPQGFVSFDLLDHKTVYCPACRSAVTPTGCVLHECQMRVAGRTQGIVSTIKPWKKFEAQDGCQVYTPSSVGMEMWDCLTIVAKELNDVDCAICQQPVEEAEAVVTFPCGVQCCVSCYDKQRQLNVCPQCSENGTEYTDCKCAEPAPKQLALVIGNDDYSGTSLTKCAQDAHDMDKLLTKLGFACNVVTNVDKGEMEAAVTSLAHELRDISPRYNTRVVVFFSGHGDEAGGRNHLIPIGNVMHSAADFDTNAVALDWVTKTVRESIQGNGVFVELLDCCRFDAENNTWRRTKSTVPVGGLKAPGLAQQLGKGSSDYTVDFLCGMACAPGCVAYEGRGRNSRYTAALLECLEKPHTLEKVMKSVTQHVLTATNGRQKPFYQCSLVNDIVLSKAAAGS